MKQKKKDSVGIDCQAGIKKIPASNLIYSHSEEHPNRMSDPLEAREEQ